MGQILGANAQGLAAGHRQLGGCCACPLRNVQPTGIVCAIAPAQVPSQKGMETVFFFYGNNAFIPLFSQKNPFCFV
jgi:hypothetical protein